MRHQQFKYKLLAFIAMNAGVLWTQCGSADAQTISVQEAMNKAYELTLDKSIAPRRAASRQTAITEPQLTYTSEVNGKTHYYVFNYPDGGFAIIGGDMAAREVLGYCPEGSFDIDKIPDGLRDMLYMYDEQIEHAIEVRALTDDTSAARTSDSRVEKHNIAQLIQTAWDQGEPYNEAIPALSDGKGNLVTGCVATALSQIMYFYKYPSVGEGSKAYSNLVKRESGDETIYVSADFGNTLYEWDDTHFCLKYEFDKDTNERLYTETQAQSVAELMYHVGVACNMNYQIRAGGAITENAINALTQNFGYNKAFSSYDRSNYSDEQWEDIVFEELQQGRPVIYSSRTPKEYFKSENWIKWIIGTDAGHCYICDGYDAERDYYHFNWGWNGSCDGYYPLSGNYALMPNRTGIGGTDKDIVYDFRYSQRMWTNVYPATITAKAISIGQSAVELPVGEQITLFAEVLPLNVADKSVIWTSSNEEIATVSATGIVTALSEGSVSITAKCASNDRLTSNCSVIISNNSSVSIGKNNRTANSTPFGNSYMYSTTRCIYTKEEIGRAGKITSISYKVTNPIPLDSEVEISIGYINSASFFNPSDGYNDVKVCSYERTIGLENGWEEYPFSTPFDYDGKSNIVVTVTRKSEDYACTLQYAHTETNFKQSIHNNKNNLTEYSKSVYGIATSRPDIKIRFNQDPTISVSSIKFKNTKQSIAVGETMTLDVDILPSDATNKELIWQSSDVSVAQVSSEGVLSARKEGIVTITATSKDNNKLVTTCDVTVLSNGSSSAYNLTQLEYWYDSHVSQKKTITLSGDIEYLDLNLPTTGLTEGLHWLRMRVKDSSGKYSGVSSSLFIKGNEEKGNQIEYWFDNDYANRGTMAMKASNATAGNFQSILDLSDTQRFPFGYHQLHFRVASPGGQYGAISTANIMRVGIGEPSYLEYWIDEDQAHSRIVSGEKNAEGGYDIVAELDLNEVPAGFHRLYYRTSSQDHSTISAVSMTPIMVKSMYNPDTSDDLKVTKLRYTIDDKKTRNIDVLKYGSVVEVKRDEDLRDLAAGEHVIKYQAQNSASLWSEMHQATFTITEPETPTISIQASVSADGLVSYTFNTIPNDKRYKVQRYTSPDDRSPVTVNSYEKDGNALQLTGVDNPTNGKYYYRVLASYTDKDGNSASIRSELQEVTVTNAHPTTEKMGVVYGRVVFENLPTGQLPYGKTKIINFSDGKTVTTDGQGMFRREGIPFGQELTLTVADDALYTYDTKSVKPMADVHNGEVSAVIRGSIKPDVTNTNVDDPEYNLYINSKIKLDQENLTLTFKVKNNSGKPWRGRIGISASEISSKNYELAFEAAKQIMYYQWSSSDQITTGIESFGIDEQKEFTFKLNDIERLKNIPEGKSQMYDFHIQYKGDNDYIWHTLGSNEAYSIQNPYPLNVESFIKDFEWTAETIEIAEEEIVKYIKDLKQTKKWVDYGKSADDFLAESIGFKGAKSEAALFKSISSKLKFVIEAGDKLTAPFEAVKKFYKEYEEYESLKNIQNPIEKYYAYVHFIWKYAEKDPIAKMYGELLKTYCDVGAVLAEKAMSFSSVTDSYGLGDLLYNGKLKFDLKFHYYFDNYLWYVSLPEAKNSSKEQQEIHKVIKSVELEIYDQSMNRVKVIDCALNINGNDIIAIPRGREDYGYQRHYILTIKWANGRVTNVPLISNNDIDTNYFENYSHVILDFESPYKNYWYQGLADEIILKKSKAK